MKLLEIKDVYKVYACNELGGGAIWPKSYITIWPILDYNNNIYQEKKVLLY